MLIKNHFVLSAIVCLLITASCNESRKDAEHSDESDFILSFSRFEKDLFETGKKDAVFIEALRKKNGSFTDLVLMQVIGLRGDNDSLLATEVSQYTGDKYIKEVYEEIKKQFSNDKWLQKELEDGLEKYHELFPAKTIPSVKTFMAPFNYNTIATDSVLGIGLDMYLGSEYQYYPSAGFPLYKIRKLRKEYITSDVIAAWLQSDYQPDQNNNDLLNNIIHEGKILYAVDEILPDVPDTIKYGYSEEQLKWCENNEDKLWTFFLEQKLLYNKNPGEYVKFINDGTTTSGFPKEAPARLGVFIGLKIVQSYMKKNDNISLQQLLEMKDGGQLLIEAGYKPKK